ncbi:MAG: 6-carboxytetrahydropterin synthase [Bacteroidia bacterium]
MITTVCRQARFNAAHRLAIPKWTDEQNDAYFGLCARPNYHGHNYKLIVKVTGEVDQETGYLLDLKILKQYIEEEVMQPFDHRNLNLDVAEFRDLNPTAENIAFVIWHKLRKRVDSNHELSITLYETERNFVEYHGK